MVLSEKVPPERGRYRDGDLERKPDARWGPSRVAGSGRQYEKRRARHAGPSFFFRKGCYLLKDTDWDLTLPAAS
jgi:hypothetical protein